MRWIALAAALAAPAAVRAQPVSDPSGPDTYLDLRFGAFIPQHRDIEDLDEGFDVGAAFGARFTELLSVEAGFGYYRLPGPGGDGVLGIGTRPALWAIPLTVDLRVRQAFQTVELSVAGGAGLHFLETGGREDAAWGFQASARAAFQLSPVMLVGLDVRRTFLEASFDDPSPGVDLGLDALFVTAVLSYRL